MWYQCVSGSLFRNANTSSMHSCAAAHSTWSRKNILLVNGGVSSHAVPTGGGLSCPPESCCDLTVSIWYSCCHLAGCGQTRLFRLASSKTSSSVPLARSVGRALGRIGGGADGAVGTASGAVCTAA